MSDDTEPQYVRDHLQVEVSPEKFKAMLAPGAVVPDEIAEVLDAVDDAMTQGVGVVRSTSQRVGIDVAVRSDPADTTVHTISIDDVMHEFDGTAEGAAAAINQYSTMVSARVVGSQVVVFPKGSKRAHEPKHGSKYGFAETMKRQVRSEPLAMELRPRCAAKHCKERAAPNNKFCVSHYKQAVTEKHFGVGSRRSFKRTIPTAMERAYAETVEAKRKAKRKAKKAARKRSR